MSDTEILRHCQALVDTLNDARGWSLPAEKLHQYAMFAVGRCREISPAADKSLCIALEHYYADHEEVTALCDRNHPLSALRWEKLHERVYKLICYQVAKADMRDDGSDSPADLTQSALHDVMTGLHSFHYDSSFNTWLTTIVSNAVVRNRRRQSAGKRTSQYRAQSLEALAEQSDNAFDTVVTPSAEDMAFEHGLLELINQVLSAHPDERLLQIFYMHVFEEQSLRAIGEKISLSGGRVHALERQAIKLLRADPAIREWLNTGDNSRINA